MNMRKESSECRTTETLATHRLDHPQTPLCVETPLWKRTFLTISVTLLFTTLTAYFFSLNGTLEFLNHIPQSAIWKTGLGVMVSFNAAVFLWRVVLFMMYRPALPCSDQELKSCTVIIPAYNEGSQVLNTLRSVMASDFPAEKLQIVCVDDGSKDDTWQWMLRGRKEFGRRVELIRSARNQGKRHALSQGFLRAKGDILVTIDSDSEIETTTLRSMVSVFCRNPRVGAVAGNVRVLNKSEGIIPKMLDVAFTYSFDFIRASQSTFNTVMCTPGALSAYDHGVVKKVHDTWLRQTFMGRPANIGEDRAMTNLILKEGRLVHFQSDAVVYTNVPLQYQGLCKMLLRWARSNIRETIAFSRFGFTRFRPEPVLGAQVDLVLQLVRMIGREVTKVAVLSSLLHWPVPTLMSLLAGIGVASIIPAALYLMRHRSLASIWALPYALFMFFGLSWVSLYALLTPHKNGWLTRTLPAPATPQAKRLPPVPEASAI